MHLSLELATLPGWVVGGAALQVPEGPLVVFSLAYVAASLFLSPDLDLARSGPNRRWGGLRWLWFPYAWLFRHRGLSHSLLFGPLTRLCYLALLALLLFLPLHFLLEVPFPQHFPSQLLAPVLAGVYLSHLLHVGLDWLAGWFSRLK